MRLAAALGLDDSVRTEVFYVSLLRFLGCTADAHGLAAVAGGDEARFLAGMAPVAMGSPREEVARLIGLVAAGQRLPRRLRALARALTVDAGNGERLLQAHCEVAARLAVELGLPGRVADALGVGYARWDGRGVPAGLGGQDIPLSVRVSVVARDLDLWNREMGGEVARKVLQRRRGHAYDPTVVDAATGIGVPSLGESREDLWEVVLSLEPQPQQAVDGSHLLRALTALGDYADLKVPERSGYARRIARTVSAAADIANLDARDRTTLVHAALVHDVGLVAVPVGAVRTWPPPGSADWERIRLHPHWSATILARCPELRQVAVAAAQHHERVDGQGYPSGLVGDLGRVSGLLACAVRFDELNAAPPGAATGRGLARIAEEMASLAASGVADRRDIDAVLGAVGAPVTPATAPRAAGLTEREIDVLRLLAHGRTNRQIAAALSVSVKTVGAHVEHIYAKAGVRSRAAATLFAMQHNLVD
jgi:HD-GYP domain-containing protein (c-di-GMP phosphodiesterase class II)/DNA-binding CsgD family transcriptional regulator